jgi:hypothetical protein
MHGRNRRRGRRNSSVQTNELDEYFAELGTGTNEHSADSYKLGPPADRSAMVEELRRLRAYVSYLGDQISELPRGPEVQAAKKRVFPKGGAPLSGIATALIAVAVLGAARILSERR